MKAKLLAAALTAAVGVGMASSAIAADVNVLWYTGGTENTGPGTYEANIGALAAPGAGDPSTATWNITFWQSGAMPTAPAGGFNVLVIASPIGDWSTFPSYTALDAANPTLGNRLLVTGQDADWHVQNTPGATNFDGPRGFLRDAVNWAADGTGMGLVDLADTDFLTVSGLATSLGTVGGGSDTVDIPPAFASFPINSNLDSAGLSNWGTSAHVSWTGFDTTMWTGINTNGGTGEGLDFITLVTEGGAGGIVGGVPEPSTWAMMLLGVGAIGAALRTTRRSVMAAA
jgi:hypothetical protein